MLPTVQKSGVTGKCSRLKVTGSKAYREPRVVPFCSTKFELGVTVQTPKAVELQA